MIYEVLRGSQDLQPLYNDDIIVWHWQAIVMCGVGRGMDGCLWLEIWVCMHVFVCLFLCMQACVLVCVNPVEQMSCAPNGFFFKQLVNQECTHHELLLAS